MPFVSNYIRQLFVSCRIKIPAGTIPLSKTLLSSRFSFKRINSSDTPTCFVTVLNKSNGARWKYSGTARNLISSHARYKRPRLEINVLADIKYLKDYLRATVVSCSGQAGIWRKLKRNTAFNAAGHTHPNIRAGVSRASANIYRRKEDLRVKMHSSGY